MTPEHDIFSSSSFQELLTCLQSEPCGEGIADWPGHHLDAMARAGVMRWDIPKDFGGIDLGPPDMLEGLRLLSAASLVSTFVLTQRSAAVRRIATSSNTTAQEALLPGLLSGELFATVGISHLTTSGQHLSRPLVSVEDLDESVLLSGTVPWATGANHADYMITGGTLDDGRQILAAVATRSEGIEVQPPVPLMGLNASQTGAVTLNKVRVAKDMILHGPVEKVMQQGTGGGAGSLGTSALAIGTAGGTLTSVRKEAERRPDLFEFLNPMQDECDRLTDELHLAAAGRHEEGAQAAENLRRRANSLALRSAQSWLAATKGAGYVSGHPAERAVRESMFFLVWSCPQPVLAANLRELACATT